MLSSKLVLIYLTQSCISDDVRSFCINMLLVPIDGVLKGFEQGTLCHPRGRAWWRGPFALWWSWQTILICLGWTRKHFGWYLCLHKLVKLFTCFSRLFRWLTVEMLKLQFSSPIVPEAPQQEVTLVSLYCSVVLLPIFDLSEKQLGDSTSQIKRLYNYDIIHKLQW